MTTLSQLSSSFFSLNFFHGTTPKRPFGAQCLPCSKIAPFGQRRFKLRVFIERWRFLELEAGKDEILLGVEGCGRKRRRKRKGKGRVVSVRFNQGSGFNGGGGGGGGGRDNSGNVRLVGNIALAVGLTYLSVTGQLGWLFDAVGWVLDALVSLWLIAVLVPILGFGAFIWWAERDILQDTCPNCGNEFQIFKSTLNDEPQLCPFCTQPFSVVDDEFVSDSRKFSKQSSTFGQSFSDFYGGPTSKGNKSSSAVIDVEAEVKDVE